MSARLHGWLAIPAVCALLLGGCADKPQAFFPQVAGADRVIASDHLLGARLVLRGPEAARLSRAISIAPGPPGGLHMGTTCSADFYRGTNLLGRIRFEAGYFGTVEPSYVCDESGLLTALQRRLLDDKAAQTNWVCMLGQMVGKAGLADLQTWREWVLRADETRRKLAQMSGGSAEPGKVVALDSRCPEEFEQVVRGVGLTQPSVSILFDQVRKPELVLMSWDDQYGFCVGPTTGYVTDFQAEQITNVAPGVFVFHRGNYFYK